MTKEKKEKLNPYEKIIAIQQEISGLKKDTKNTYFKSTYMNLGSIVNTIKPILHSNDCFSTHQVQLDEERRPKLWSKICYKDGTVLLECEAPLLTKDVNDPQKLGGAITYMRRYNLTAMLEIEEEDDDGNQANTTPSLKNISRGLKDDISNLQNQERANKANRKAGAEEYFRGIKKRIEDCGSVDEIDALLEKEGSAIGKLRSGYKTIYNQLMVCVADMKAIIDPDHEDPNL